jgi:hypothetical protein
LPKNAQEALANPCFLLIGAYDPHCGEYTFLAPPLGVWRLADRSFVQDIPSNADNVETRKASIAMAHDLNIEVAAEGVETRAQMKFLVRHGCDRAQGHFIDHALPAADFERRLHQRPNIFAQRDQPAWRGRDAA